MNLLEKIRLIERVDGLIKRKSTGPPTRLATRLNISERNIYNLINVMKEMGAPIYFCKDRNSYCYEENGGFSFGFRADERRLYGGIKQLPMPFLGLQNTCSGGGYVWFNNQHTR